MSYYAYEVELTLSSARDLKNVNWRHGPLRPYTVVWVDPNKKSTSKVDEVGDTCPSWDEKLVIPFPGPIDDESKLHIDIVHAGREEDTKPLIGSAKLRLKDVINEVGFDERDKRTLQPKRPSGRPQGKLDVKVLIREPRSRAQDPYYAPPYGVPPPTSASRDYPPQPSAYGTPYAAPPPDAYYRGGPPPPNPYYGGAATPSGYPQYGGYGQAPSYGAQPYGQAPPYGQGGSGYYGQEEKKKSKFGGMGTGLAVGAVAGALGGLALAEGFDALEDKIADDAAEKVEDDLGYDGDDF